MGDKKYMALLIDYSYFNAQGGYDARDQPRPHNAK